MKREDALGVPVLRGMVDRLAAGLGGRLRSVVLYGSAARDDFQAASSDFNLIVVLADLEIPTLEALAPAFAWWRRQGQLPPRFFSLDSLARETDAFPIEFLDIRDAHLALAGDDPFAGLEVRRQFLRLQCERELREKLMRLREGYVESHARPENLRRLLVDSYTTFVALFRGCLCLLGAPVPSSTAEVAAAFCARAGLEAAPFETVDRLRRGGRMEGDLKALFVRYHDELSKAVRVVDRLDGQGEGGGHR